MTPTPTKRRLTSCTPETLAEGIIVEVAHIHEKGVRGILSQGFWVRNGGQTSGVTGTYGKVGV
jgi:hypothetical protein